mmetsp:Transcript_16216/g.29499  ORF Transcript_16216/g.29499 Transcript_16216/m.29499 type:complete len:113 (+) Transcript_16216:99-437(+)
MPSSCWATCPGDAPDALHRIRKLAPMCLLFRRVTAKHVPVAPTANRANLLLDGCPEALPLPSRGALIACLEDRDGHDLHHASSWATACREVLEAHAGTYHAMRGYARATLAR